MKAIVQPQSCTVAWLLAPWFKLTLDNILVGMTLDSRVLKQSEMFVALQGAISDGRTFIANAIDSGASVVLAETKDSTYHGKVERQLGIPVIHFFELNKYLNAIAMRFYFEQPNVIPQIETTHNIHNITAVTGTNGKTTIATLLANSYMLLGKKSAQMGTIGNGLYGQLKASLNTTLDAISVCRELNDYQSKGVDQTVMEVSSHGLVQGRISAIPFKTAIFTNLTRDHLDYHGTMQSYADAKKKLFQEFSVQNKIINADDPVGQAWLKEFPEAIAYGVSLDIESHHQTYLKITHVDYLPQGLVFRFMSSWGEGCLSAPFYGDFNVANIAAVTCALLADGFSIPQIETITPELTVVPGRMEQYHFTQQQVTFVVDYAHTPDALASALKALQYHKQQGRIIAVFGCGGDRDKGKRAEMAKAAEQGADHVVIVDDNPRSEDAKSIVNDIKLGFDEPDKVDVIHDRQQAILHLLDTAQPNDIVLVAGKGHEDYQIFGNKKVHYSDRECLSALLSTGYTKQDPSV